MPAADCFQQALAFILLEWGQALRGLVAGFPGQLGIEHHSHNTSIMCVLVVGACLGVLDGHGQVGCVRRVPGDKSNQGCNLFIAACACPVEAGPLVLGKVAQSHCEGFAGNRDDLNLGLGVCRGRGVCTINRLRLRGFCIHLCFDFRQGLAYYAGMFFEAAYVRGFAMSDFRQVSNTVPYTSSSQNST